MPPQFRGYILHLYFKALYSTKSCKVFKTSNKITSVTEHVKVKFLWVQSIEVLPIFGGYRPPDPMGSMPLNHILRALNFAISYINLLLFAHNFHDSTVRTVNIQYC